MQLHQMYTWHFDATPNRETNKIHFKAAARFRNMSPPPTDIKSHPEYDDFVCMCHEWQTCVEMFRENIERGGIRPRHTVGEINLNLGDGEAVLFEDVFTFPEGTNFHTVLNLMQPLTTIMQETVDFLNSPKENAAATS